MEPTQATPTDGDVESGEILADLELTGFRYHALCHVPYERRTLLVGGPILFAASATASAVGNRRRRAAAERLAAPQWRCLGPLRVLVTCDRLLVWHEGSWASVWFASVVDIEHDPANGTLDLYFADDPPYRFVGQASDDATSVMFPDMEPKVTSGI